MMKGIPTREDFEKEMMLTSQFVLNVRRQATESHYVYHPVFENDRSQRRACSEPLGSKHTAVLNSWHDAFSQLIEKISEYEIQNDVAKKLGIGKSYLHRIKKIGAMYEISPFYSLENVRRLTELFLDEEYRSKVLANMIAVKQVDLERQAREKKFGKMVYPAPKDTRFLDQAGTTKHSRHSPYR